LKIPEGYPRKIRTLLHGTITIASFLCFQHTTKAAETIDIPKLECPNIAGLAIRCPTAQARQYQVYTVQEIDAMVSGVRKETTDTATAVRTESEALKTSIKEQVLKTLDGISEKLLSDDLKNKLSSDISDSIAQKVNVELEQFKVDLTKEILATVDNRIQKANELQRGQQ
jgi:hypothetical protein